MSIIPKRFGNYYRSSYLFIKRTAHHLKEKRLFLAKRGQRCVIEKWTHFYIQELEAASWFIIISTCSLRIMKHSTKKIYVQNICKRQKNPYKPILVLLKSMRKNMGRVSQVSWRVEPASIPLVQLQLAIISKAKEQRTMQIRSNNILPIQKKPMILNMIYKVALLDISIAF